MTPAEASRAMTFAEWKAQLVPSVNQIGEERTLRFYDPSSDRSIAQPVHSGAQMADLRGYLPRLLWNTRHHDV